MADKESEKYIPIGLVDIRAGIDLLEDLRKFAADERHKASKNADPSVVGTFAYRKARVDEFVKKSDEGLVLYLKPKDKNERKLYERTRPPLTLTTMVYSQVDTSEEQKDAMIDAIYERLQIMAMHNFILILDQPGAAILKRLGDLEVKVKDCEVDLEQLQKDKAADRLVLRWIAKWVKAQIRKKKDT